MCLIEIANVNDSVLTVSVGVEANSAKVYEKVLNDRQYKTMFDLVEAQPSREDLLRYGLEDDRNMLVFLKGLRDASAEFDRKKSSKGTTRVKDSTHELI